MTIGNKKYFMQSPKKNIKVQVADATNGKDCRWNVGKEVWGIRGCSGED